MSLVEKEGILDRITEKGILLSGDRLSYSKWFEGDRPTEDLLGCKIRVVIDAGEKVSFVKKILKVDGKASDWKPPADSDKGSFAGGGRRLSPDELELKRNEGVRIARSVAIDRAILMVKEGIPIEKIADLARAVETYILKGDLPQAAKAGLLEVPVEKGPDVPPSANPQSSPAPGPVKTAATSLPKPKRLAARMISALFNEALRGGLVDDWQDFLAEIERVLKVQVSNPYQMNSGDFSKVEAVFRTKLGGSTAA